MCAFTYSNLDPLLSCPFNTSRDGIFFLCGFITSLFPSMIGILHDQLHPPHFLILNKFGDLSHHLLCRVSVEVLFPNLSESPVPYESGTVRRSLLLICHSLDRYCLLIVLPFFPYHLFVVLCLCLFAESHFELLIGA